VPVLQTASTSVLQISFEESGPAEGPPVVLMHGFPYSVRGYDGAVAQLVAAGCRCLVPHLRGYGPTRFLDASTLRSGQQAALGNDLLEFLDGVDIERAVLCGFDWGGRAACIVAALWPHRCAGLVTCGGYNIQDIAASVIPGPPELEHALWYQYYFHTERGRAGLAADRRGIARLLWRLWSPPWQFDEETFATSAAALDNPDFVDVVVHSYRHRFGYATGDPTLETIEERLAAQPSISVPTISLDGDDGGFGPADRSAEERAHFVGRYEQRILAGVGHNVPQEAPDAFAAAVLDLLGNRVPGQVTKSPAQAENR
jgi:pimeloyl-ACP methyl ester carboxylesterase